MIHIFGGIAAAQFLFALFLFAFAQSSVMRATLGMGLSLYLLWIVLFGLATLRFRDPVRRLVRRSPLPWSVTFVVFCTLLAMLEEAITTSLTNAAPLFGSEIGKAYITASTNYLDVILGNSVIFFVPMFIGWAFLLRRYRFTPNEVFLLFGVLGTIGEMMLSGPSHIAEIGMWMFVYGLMIYLPAYCLPDELGTSTKRRRFLLAIVVPMLFQLIDLPVVPLIQHLRPSVNDKYPPNFSDHSQAWAPRSEEAA